MFTNDKYLATSACHHNVTKPSDSCHVQSVTIMSPNLHSCHVQSVTIMSPNLHSCHVQSVTIMSPNLHSCHVQSVTIMSPNLHSCHVQSVTIISPNLHSCHVQSDTLTQPCSTCHHNATRPSDFSHVQSVTTVSPLHQNLVLINLSSYCYQTLRLSPFQPVTMMSQDIQTVLFNLLP